MDVGDISGVNPGLVELATKVDVSLIKMAMDSSKENTQAMIKIMNASAKQLEGLAKPNLGGNIDVSV